MGARRSTRGVVKPRSSSGMVGAAALPPKTLDDHKDDQSWRGQTPKTLFAQPEAFRSIEQFEHALGGRQQMAEALLTSPDLTDPIRKVLTLIIDPRFGSESLAYLCASAGVTPGDVFAAFRDATVAKANIQALQLVAARLPEITAKVIEGALGGEMECGTCRGKGTIDKWVKDKSVEAVCPTCYGHKTVKIAPDPDQQERLFTLTGLLKSGGPGISITNQQQNITPTPSGEAVSGASLAQLQQAVSRLLFAPPTEVIDVASTTAAGTGERPTPEGDHRDRTGDPPAGSRAEGPVHG